MTKKSFALPALLLFLAFFGIFTLPARLHVGDPYTWREEARSLILIQRLGVIPELATSHGEKDQYFVKNPMNDFYYSKYGVMNGLLSLPPLLAELALEGEIPPWDSDNRRVYFGLFSVLLSLGIAWALFRMAKHYTESELAASLFVLLTFFATYLSYYLRAANTEIPQVLFFCLFFERMARFRASGFTDYHHTRWAWLFLLCLVLTKISFLPLLGFLGLALFVAELFLKKQSTKDKFKNLALHAALPALIAAVVVARVQYIKFGGHFRTGYVWVKDDYSHSIPPWEIFRNLFLNEQWGLPTHFPLLFLVPFGALAFYRRFRFDAWLGFSSFLLYFLLVGSLPIWKGEWAYGPRYFLFALPALCLPAVLALEWFVKEIKKKTAPALVAGTAGALLFGYSAYLQFEVARLDPFFQYWTAVPVICDRNPEVREYLHTTHYGRLNAEAWAHREKLSELPWLAELKKDCLPDVYADYEKKIALWLRRTNFYWFSPRD